MQSTSVRCSSVMGCKRITQGTVLSVFGRVWSLWMLQMDAGAVSCCMCRPGSAKAAANMYKRPQCIAQCAQDCCESSL